MCFTCHAPRNGEPDYTNFLRLCYLVGLKTAPDALPHMLTGVYRGRVLQRARDVRLALATVEYCDCLDFYFEDGALEYDTASTAIRRSPTTAEVLHMQ